MLADSVNLMTDRLREQMAREEESRQFQSFMRLSAMLTHDLKNAIASLSLLVRNMERQSHNAEFRADAMRSLKDATDKLRALVAKLSEPVRSLSGEFQLPRPTDLVPIIKRVLPRPLKPPSAPRRETRLPPLLVARSTASVWKRSRKSGPQTRSKRWNPKVKLTIEGERKARIKSLQHRDTGPRMSESFSAHACSVLSRRRKPKASGRTLHLPRSDQAHGGPIDVKSRKALAQLFRVVFHPAISRSL